MVINNFNASAVEEALLSGYIGVDKYAMSKEAIEKSIIELQKELNRQMSKLAKVSSSWQGLKLSTDFVKRVLVKEYPEVVDLSVDTDTNCIKLGTSEAPMQFVYSGENCFYESTKSLAYTLWFKPGWAYLTNDTKRVTLVLDELSTDQNTGDITVMCPGTHPHNRGGNSTGFSDLCTGRHNPFFSRLSGSKLRDMTEFKELTKFALRWMRTFNVNDSYNTPTLNFTNNSYFPAWVCSLEAQRATSGLKESIAATNLLYSEFVEELVSLMEWSHRKLQDWDSAKKLEEIDGLVKFSDFDYGMPITGIELNIPTSVSNFVEKICCADIKGTAHGRVVLGLQDALMDISAGEITNEDIEVNRDILRQAKRTAGMTNTGESSIQYAFVYTAMVTQYMALMQVYQTAYAWLMALMVASEEVMIVSWYPASSILLNDMMRPSIGRDRRHRYTHHISQNALTYFRYAAAMQQSQSQSQNQDKYPTGPQAALETFYGAALQAPLNLFKVIPPSRVKDGSILKKIKNALNIV